MQQGTTATPKPGADTLRLSRRTDRCTVLGPGARAVLWVQGCPFRCAGCVAPETLPFEGGELVDVRQMADHLAGLNNIEGITFSGGEPMAQAEALSRLIQHLRPQRPEFSYVSYTGFLHQHLLHKGTTVQRQFLSELDMLIDGPYVAARHTDKIWRGSDNQRIHFLTPRYAEAWKDRVHDRGQNIEFELSADGSLAWMGIPAPGFRQNFEAAMAARGIPLVRASLPKN